MVIQNYGILKKNGFVKLYIILELFHEQTIPGHENLSIRSLVWCQNEFETELSLFKYKLFGTGLQGQIFEVNLHSLSIENKSDSYGGPVWMMAKNPQNHTLACACEDGSIRLFDTSGENIMYLRSIQMLVLF